MSTRANEDNEEGVVIVPTTNGNATPQEAVSDSAHLAAKTRRAELEIERMKLQLELKRCEVELAKSRFEAETRQIEAEHRVREVEITQTQWTRRVELRLGGTKRVAVDTPAVVVGIDDDESQDVVDVDDDDDDDDMAPVRMLQLCIKSESVEILLDEVDPDWTVGRVKELVDQEEGIAAANQVLYFRGARVFDNSTLASCGIGKREPGKRDLGASTTIRLFEKPVSGQVDQIFLKSMTGKTLTFDVCLEWTVERFKMLVQDKVGIPVVQQRLIFEGQQLESSRRLVDYGVENECTLQVVLRLRGC